MIKKSIGRSLLAIWGFAYELVRFIRYSSCCFRSVRNQAYLYGIIQINHSIEKSLSIEQRNKDSGWRSANLLLSRMSHVEWEHLSVHEKHGIRLIHSLISSDPHHPDAIRIQNQLAKMGFSAPESYQSPLKYADELSLGLLPDPEGFFFSRWSVRNYDRQKVNDDTFERALQLALKTPSSCNRQPWHIYHTNEAELIQAILRVQGGMRGFETEVYNLPIITYDLHAFESPVEKNQGIVDSAMFGMSFIFALHSLGIESCALNWNYSPRKDKKIRKLINIAPYHSVTLMIVFGYAKESNLVCESIRNPLSTFLSEIQLLEKRR